MEMIFGQLPSVVVLPGDQLPSTRVVEGLDYASLEDAIDPKSGQPAPGVRKGRLGQSPIYGTSIIILWKTCP